LRAILDKALCGKIHAPAFDDVYFDYFADVNLIAITCMVEDGYYRLCMGINGNEELFMERNQNGTTTRLWTAVSDTGWISLVPYINTGFAARSTDMTTDYCPAYRIMNGVVYFRGFIYSTSAKNTQSMALCLNMPSEILIGERGGGGVRFQGSAYQIRSESGNLNVYDTATIGAQGQHQGYGLACLSYPLE
jgi:hypothetical protein